MIGNLIKNIKRISFVSILYIGENKCYAVESSYKIRIHKNFIKEIMDKNFNVILDHV